MRTLLIFSFVIMACTASTPPVNGNINTEGTTIEQRFPAPRGTKRVALAPNSFGAYLRQLPLKPHGSPVHLFDGSEKATQGIAIAVIDMPISPRDLQQCADAVMRLRGEYLFAEKRYSDIHFNFVSDGKPRYFTDYAKGDLSYQRFLKYMDWVFAYANTRSLYAELQQAKWEALKPGDVFVQTGNPYGHAVTVLDVAIDTTSGEKLFMLGQSYMPAQETHVLYNPAEANGSPWYRASNYGVVSTPEWQFNNSDLRKFAD